MDSFLRLLDLHADLDAAFAEHQFALLHTEFGKALELLTAYETALLAHMDDEEKILLPLYTERAEIERGGSEKLFLDEHEKMRHLITLFRDATEELGKETKPERHLIRLLDREAFYKRLCSHHDIREENILYPALDKVTTAEERIALFERLTSRPSHLVADRGTAA